MREGACLKQVHISTGTEMAEEKTLGGWNLLGAKPNKEWSRKSTSGN